MTAQRPALTRVILIVIVIGAACASPEQEPSESSAFTERTVVFLLADSARIAAARAGYSEDDFYVIADDMMWYRAEAWRWFEERGITVLNLEGRPVLHFRVAGEDRSYTFSDETLDLVILYEPGKEPLAVAPIDVGATAPSYFE